jgi:hypothetical protein
LWLGLGTVRHSSESFQQKRTYCEIISSTFCVTVTLNCSYVEE